MRAAGRSSPRLDIVVMRDVLHLREELRGRRAGSFLPRVAPYKDGAGALSDPRSALHSAAHGSARRCQPNRAEASSGVSTIRGAMRRGQSAVRAARRPYRWGTPRAWTAQSPAPFWGAWTTCRWGPLNLQPTPARARCSPTNGWHHATALHLHRKALRPRGTVTSGRKVKKKVR